MLNRRQIRTKVMQALYAHLASGNPSGEVFNQLLDEDYRQLRTAHARQAASEGEAGEDDAAFLRDLFLGVARHQAEYEALIVSCLENWDLQRIASIDRILLMMGLHELLDCPTVPVKVTINEYLDLAKEFSTDKSSQFVNGILDKLHTTLKAQDRIRKHGRGLLDPPGRQPPPRASSPATTHPEA